VTIDPNDPNDPVATSVAWIGQARAAGDPIPEAVALATASRDGVPSVRMVLMRGLSEGAPRFFTHYESRKAHEIADNPRAAFVFHWKVIERQARIEGTVQRLSAAESDAYFAQRPRGSQLSASVSPQSRPIDSLQELHEARRVLEASLGERPVPRPPNWGGYRLVPTAVELWRSGDARLHDRERFERTDDGWTRQRLAP
jgi:pyridoxamine 5'-phosphate oxidase